MEAIGSPLVPLSYPASSLPNVETTIRKWRLSFLYFPLEFGYEQFSSLNMLISFCMWLGMQNKWSHCVHLLPRFPCSFVCRIHSYWQDPLLPFAVSHISHCLENTITDSIHSSVEGHLGDLLLLCSYKQSLLCILLAHFICTGSMIITPLSMRFWKLKLLPRVTWAKFMTQSLPSASPYSQLFQITIPKLKQFPTCWL